MKTKIAIIMLFLSFATAVNANLIRNSSFETIPGNRAGQGFLPSDWEVANVTPDTYSNDGAYGLLPSAFGNFPGVTAFDGVRWIAGWSAASERFGQTLSDPLIEGLTYTLSGYLHQAQRSDLDFAGGYNLYLTSDNTGDIGAGAFLGSLGPTTASDGWEFASLTFTGPSSADALSFLLFDPIADASGTAYPGLDSVSLTTVPIPAAAWMFVSALLFLFGHRRRRQR